VLFVVLMVLYCSSSSVMNLIVLCMMPVILPKTWEHLNSAYGELPGIAQAIGHALDRDRVPAGKEMPRLTIGESEERQRHEAATLILVTIPQNEEQTQCRAGKYHKQESGIEHVGVTMHECWASWWPCGCTSRCWWNRSRSR
jgi:hypothetical protein